MTVYEIVTQKILDKLDAGVAPWHKPWRGGAAFQPKSFATRKGYRGINVWLLSMAAQDAGYKSPYWITYKKAKQLEGQVRKGEKSTLVVFWKRTEKEEIDDTGEHYTRASFLLRYYNVFNIEQVDGLDESKLPADAIEPDGDLLDFEPIECCEHIVQDMPNKPDVQHSTEPRAYYKPSGDYVHLPNRDTFENEPEYYSVAFHELGHSTGHEKRLNRPDMGKAAFGSCDYSKEELVAEMTAAMLCGVAGIDNQTIDNSASYIDNWRRAIKGDSKLVVHAAAAAQKAADYILGKDYKAE
jgi:antirestriction protein ArdC